ncbi:MAG: carboxypeptidase regulatory-like domain-containing protein [Candidatus Aminicenantes bacterium]|nr:carboxypeptidase regulatory-like domain-containing protein [Candidatus Aminicenantes bacterium]MDH5742887.1 carboxypeptidase regulatory-like domain-containing protein [Candidatus Aminicenantes bacterium]
MSKFFKAFSILLSFVLVASAPLLAQTSTGTLKIIVVDDDGAVLPGVALTLSSPVMMGEKTLITNVLGEALFINLTPGTYQIKSRLAGFGERISEEIQVSLDRQTLLQVEMKPTVVEESITVIAVSPAVDTTKSVIAEHVTHETVESLPISRDFVGYLQLAAGVNVVPNSQGRDTPQDPAGKGGLNYADRGAQGIGGKRGSRDNFYFIDGMNITGLTSQRAGMAFNNEVIQEQELMTSGVPAEYGGGKGVVGNIVTKAGGNRLSGSINFYYQPDAFYLNYSGGEYGDARDPSKLEGYKDNKYDTAATLGGPILKDKLWFFLSGQLRNDANTFPLSASASQTQEEVDYANDRKGAFGKLSFKLSANDSISLIGFLDSYGIEGSRDVNTPKTRVPKDDYEMYVFSGYYQRVFGENVIVDFRYGRYHWSNVWAPLYPDAGAPDTMYFIPEQYPPIYQQQFGGYATGGDFWHSRDQFNLNAEWYMGNMRIKTGASYTNEYSYRDSSYYFDEGSLSSVDPALVGWTLGELMDAKIWPISEMQQRLLPYLNNNWGPTSEAYDLDHNGVLTETELRAATFTDLNEHGLNFWRIITARSGVNKVRAQRYFGYLMDDWKINKYFTINAGARIEKHDYYDSEAIPILKMPWRLLPRIGLVWNIGGRGTHKMTLFYGQFSDPTPFGMIHFGGNISGSITHEQIYLNHDWYTYRIRGSAEVRDCSWTPGTRDNYAHEFSITHEIDTGNNLVFATQAYYRGDRRIIEDYDLYTYVDAYRGHPFWGKYALSFEDFGFGPEGPSGPANYFLSNLIGAKRDIYGLDFEVSKRFDNGSMLVAQYSFKHALGNSQSDGNADLQGDMIEIDPRCPWMWGRTPGTIPHKFKVFGTYRTPFGLDIGALFYWNAGMYFTESYNFMPLRYGIYLNWPLNDEWTDFVKTGEEKTPAYYQIDIKFNYGIRIYGNVLLDLFLDIYNITNNQAPIDIAYSQNDPEWNYQETSEILLPMRFYLGARIRF